MNESQLKEIKFGEHTICCDKCICLKFHFRILISYFSLLVIYVLPITIMVLVNNIIIILNNT